MIIKIPIRLVSEANSSEHWTKKYKRRRIQKLLVKMCLAREKLPDLPCKIKLTRISPLKLDVYDNLPMCFKYVLDAVCDVLVPGLASGRADGDPRIHGVDFFQEKGAVGEYAITIEITTSSPGASQAPSTS